MDESLHSSLHFFPSAERLRWSKEDKKEAPDLNTDQRLIIMGSEIKERLGSVALWLDKHNIDIKVIETELHQDGETTFLEPHVIIPQPVSKFVATGQPRGEGDPWKTNGRSWHLEKRCSPATNKMLLKVDQIIRDNLDVEEAKWAQQNYISYKIGNNIWLWINTGTRSLELNFFVHAGTFEEKQLAQRLQVEADSNIETRSEKLKVNTVKVENRDEAVAYVHLRIREAFDLSSQAFLDFLKEAYAAFAR